MLESIRKRRNSVIILGAFAAIIVVFIFWGAGPGGNKGQDNSTVATVDGQAIQVREYAALYKKELEYYRNTFKEQFTDEVARKLDLRQRTLDILINRALALKDAGAKGVAVSEAEVQDAIRAIPAFSQNGSFDKDLYFRLLSGNRITPADFERSVHEDLVTNKMRGLAVKDVSVSDAEAKAAYVKDGRKVNLGYLIVDGARFAGSMKATDDEAKEYLKKNGSAFITPARVKAFYAYADFNGLARKTKVGDAEVKEYYGKNTKEFETPASVKARHILIRPDEKAQDKEKAKAEARKKIEEILAKMKGGAKFPELAKAYSQDPGSARQDGDLGWFPKGVMIKPFEEAAFALDKGKMSGVIETEFGFHIILVEDKKEGGPKPLKDVSASIRNFLSTQKAHMQARDSIAALENAFKNAKTVEELKKASAGKDVKAVATDFLSEADKRHELIKNEALRGELFALKNGEVSKPMETEEGVYVIKAVEKSEPRVPEYGTIAAKVKAIVVMEKANGAAAKKAGEFLGRVKGGEDLATLAKKEKYKVEETGYFTKAQGFIPKVGAPSGDKENIFDLTPAAPYYPEVVAQNNRFFILKLNSAEEADESGFEARKEAIKARLLAQKQDEAVNKWIEGLRAKAKIKVFENLL